MASRYLPPFRIDIERRPGTARLLPDAELARYAASALRAGGAPGPASLGLVLSDDAELAGLNAAHMGKPGPTDVLSFPLLPPEAYPSHPGREAGRGAAAAGAAARDSAIPGSAIPGSAMSGGAMRGSPAPEGFVLPPGRRPHLGDVVVSVERAVAQAEDGRGGQTGDIRWSPADELRLLVVHGVLHICGWDHADPVEEAAMRDLERRLLERRPAGPAGSSTR